MPGLTVLGVGPVTSLVVLGVGLVSDTVTSRTALLHFAAPAERVQAEERR